MSRIDLWEKAAECARAIELSINPHEKAMLSNLQQMWIALANRRKFLTEDELTREASKIGRLQEMFGGSEMRRLH
jgi:hypothetical protein